MGFPEDVDRNLMAESDIIVGVIDTGVWPESESFNDRGYGAPPKKWKGACRGGKNFSCNKKLCLFYKQGAAIDTLKRKRVKWPLVYGKDVSRNCSEADSKKCAEGCLNTSLVRNKIVVCDELADSTEAFQAGAAGIIKKTPSIYPPFVVPFPESRLTRREFASILSYINSTKHEGTTPKAYISATKTRHNRSAPKVAGFSARRPNSIIPDILKPDVTAPGETILAAFSPAATPSLLVDKRSVNYSILSGTSMACPHVSGAAAYVKSFGPNWSPAAIKSALMTTAWSLKNRKIRDAEFAYGAGHIDPVRASDPGLVYDTSIDDYIKLLRSLGYDTTTLRKITGDNKRDCPKTGKVGSKHNDINYPSMAAKAETNRSFSVKFLRRVTNVGRPKTVYRAKIIKDSNINVVVKPRILRFKALNERKSFVVSVEGKIGGAKKIGASLEWSDGIYRVASPIVVYDDSAF